MGWRNSLQQLGRVQHRTRPDEFCIVLLRRSPLLVIAGAFRTLLRTSAVYGDGSSTAPYRAELLALPDSSVQATPVQDLVRREDSEYLVAFKEKILLSSEELNETVGSEDLLGFTSMRLSNGQVFTGTSSGDWFHWEW